MSVSKGAIVEQLNKVAGILEAYLSDDTQSQLETYAIYKKKKKAVKKALKGTSSDNRILAYNTLKTFVATERASESQTEFLSEDFKIEWQILIDMCKNFEVDLAPPTPVFSSTKR